MNEIKGNLSPTARRFSLFLAKETDDLPVDLIILHITSETTNFDLEIGYVPDFYDQLENIKLLQFLAIVPGQPKTVQSQEEIESLILSLNSQIPLMGFGFDRDNNSIFFRHLSVLMKEKQSLDEQLIKETVWLICYLLETFYPLFQKVI